MGNAYIPPHVSTLSYGGAFQGQVGGGSSGGGGQYSISPAGVSIQFGGGSSGGGGQVHIPGAALHQVFGAVKHFNKGYHHGPPVHHYGHHYGPPAHHYGPPRGFHKGYHFGFGHGYQVGFGHGVHHGGYPPPAPAPAPAPTPAPPPSGGFAQKTMQALNNGADVWIVSQALGGNDFGIASVEVANDVRWVLNDAGFLPPGHNVTSTVQATQLLGQAFGSAPAAQQAIWAQRLANNIGVDFGVAAVAAANQNLAGQVGVNPDFQANRDHFYGAQQPQA